MELFISSLVLLVFFAGCAIYLQHRAKRNEKLKKIQASKPIRTTSRYPGPDHIAARKRQWEEAERIRKERERIQREHEIALAKARANGEPDPLPPPGGKA